jgi:ecotropic viral integration site 5 protein
MELETQVQVSGNQLRRQDDDNKAVREQLELAETKQRDIVAKLREQQNKYTDLESKVCLLKNYF